MGLSMHFASKAIVRGRGGMLSIAGKTGRKELTQSLVRRWLSTSTPGHERLFSGEHSTRDSGNQMKQLQTMLQGYAGYPSIVILALLWMR